MKKADATPFSRPSRRDVHRFAAGLLATPLAAELAGRAEAQAQKVSFASYGGSFNDAFVAAYAKDFEAKTGVAVEMGSGASLALAKLQATTPGGAQWDLVELTGSEYEAAVKEGLLLPLDPKIVDRSKIPDEYYRPYGVKYAIFMFLMAWDQRKIPDADAPKNWAEFWDTKKYPGRRSLYSNIGDGAILEAALLADGVKLENLYPLDVDRALASLDKLGRDNIIWHSTNAEPVQQLVNGQVSLATSWLGRATRAIKSGAKIGLNPHYGGVSGDYITIMKSSKRAKQAQELVNYVVADADANAHFVKVSNNAVPNTDALAKLPPEIVNTLPTSPELATTVFLKNDQWWAENLETATLKFKQWQLK